jgi:hypothetical protein
MKVKGQGTVALLLACAIGAGAGVVVGVVSTVAPAQAAPPAGEARSEPLRVESVRYRAGPDKVVATFHRTHPEFAEQAPTPLLSVFGDRTVRVHQPAFMKNAGRFEMRLDQAEMDGLMRTLADAVLGFDERDVRLQQRQAELEKWNAAARLEDVTIEYVADATVSRFEIDIEAYRPAGVGTEVALAGPRAVARRALSFEAQRYPTIRALTALRAVEEQLLELTLDPRLQRTGAAP